MEEELHKVAIEYSINAWKKSLENKLFTSPTLVDAFKAGAKWMERKLN